MTKPVARLGILILLLSSLAACVAYTPPPDRPRYDPGYDQPAYNSPSQCIQDNRRAHADVWQQFQQARSAGRISPSEERQFRSLENRLNSIKQRLYRSGLTEYECQRISREIDNERAAVQRMAATPAYNPDLSRCIQDNRRAQSDVWQQFQRARSAGRISPHEERQFRSMEDRLNTIKQRLYRDGLTMSECQRINREIDRERNAVRRMSETRPRY